MRINDLVKPETMTIKHLRDQFNSGELYVDHSFQRRYVWLRKNQIKLIETILLGYIIPEIYIWDQDTDPDTGVSKKSIVDGQQRIGAIVEFINGKYRLSQAYLDTENATYANKTFAELSSEEKRNIWDYTLSIQRISSEVQIYQVKQIFLRLNSTDKSLNPQELRNAEYDGLFLKTAIDIADYPFWKNHHVFSDDALRRMKDVEFASSLLLFLRKGIDSEDTQTSINSAYDLYNEVYDERDLDKSCTYKILDEIEHISQKDTDNILEGYISKTTHLYTIFVTLYAYVIDNQHLSDSQINNLLSFYKGYKQSDVDEAKEFDSLHQEGTRSKSNRIKRMRILQKAIEGVLHL